MAIYNLDADNAEPILMMKLCNYFDPIQYMSVTSDRFKNVELYYDCCLPNEEDNCHVYDKPETHFTSTTTGNANIMAVKYTTPISNETNTNMPMESSDAMGSPETTMEPIESTETAVDDFESLELTHFSYSNGVGKKKIFLDTSNFDDTGSTLYIYENGTSIFDYCAEEIADVELTQNDEEDLDDYDEEDDPEIKYFVPPGSSGPSGSSGLQNAIKSLIG